MSRRNANSVLPDRHLISTTKAAEYLDVSPGTIRQTSLTASCVAPKSAASSRLTPEI